MEVEDGWRQTKNSSWQEVRTCKYGTVDGGRKPLPCITRIFLTTLRVSIPQANLHSKYIVCAVLVVVPSILASGTDA